MDWIDDTIAIGSWIDARCVRTLKKERIDLLVDSRALFLRRPGSLTNEPNIDLIDRSARMLIDLSNLNAKVLVYCRHGKDRSPFLAMVYLCKRRGISFEQAHQLVRSRRPRIVYHDEWVKMLEASTKK